MTVSSFLKNNEIDPLDLRIIVEQVCNLSPAQLITHSDMEIEQPLADRINECCEKRKNGAPIAYIFNRKDFYKSTFYTPQGVLIPRPDTETLVEEAIKTIDLYSTGEDIKILDLCAGTGCAGISVAGEAALKCKSVKLLMSDVSGVAFDCFSVNAARILRRENVEFEGCLGDLFGPVKIKDFNLIITNPPYICTDVIPTLSREVLQEPVLALDGGTDGLDLIRRIVAEAPEYISGGGWLIVEIGYDQGEAVKGLFEASGFSDVSVVKDLGCNDRVVKGRLL